MARRSSMYYAPGGKPFVCPMCGSEEFYQRWVQLNTGLASFFDLDWLNTSAATYTCAECTHITWFAKELVVRRSNNPGSS